jgi:uncharacterized protein
MSSNHNDTNYAADEDQTSFPAVIVFCKRPHAGNGKQRLAKSIGPESALGIAEALLDCTLEDVRDWPGRLVIAPASAADRDWAGSLHTGADVIVQTDGNLGQRLQHIDQFLLQQGCAQRIFIGTDAPLLSQHTLHDAARAMQHNDVVLQPALDGGVTLMATKPAWPDLNELPWSNSDLGLALQAACLVAGHSLFLLPASIDIDVLADLHQVRPALLDDHRLARQNLLQAIDAVLAPGSASIESTA